MPTHCDAIDGPVVTAAKAALEAGTVRIVLPYVPLECEAEVSAAFEETLRQHQNSSRAAKRADLQFLDTVVRLHCQAAGAAYTGLKPAGQDRGPAVPKAKEAIATRSSDDLIELLSAALRTEVIYRLLNVLELQRISHRGLDAERAYINAMLDFQVWSDQIYRTIKAPPRGHRHERD